MTTPIAELKVAYFYVDISQHVFATNSPYKTFGKKNLILVDFCAKHIAKVGLLEYTHRGHGYVEMHGSSIDNIPREYTVNAIKPTTWHAH